MIYISHRGNIDSPVQTWGENTEKAICACLKMGLHVEVDVRKIGDELWLGHDGPEERIEYEALGHYAEIMWLHCKNLEALEHLLKPCIFNVLWHEDDRHTLTTSGHIFTRPGEPLTPLSVAVMPEMADYSVEELAGCYAICSDKINHYRDLVENGR